MFNSVPNCAEAITKRLVAAKEETLAVVTLVYPFGTARAAARGRMEAIKATAALGAKNIAGCFKATLD
jgi:hypothetical protein